MKPAAITIQKTITPRFQENTVNLGSSAFLSTITTPFIQSKASPLGSLCIWGIGVSTSEKVDCKLHKISHLSPHCSSLQQHTKTSPALYTTNLCHALFRETLNRKTSCHIFLLTIFSKMCEIKPGDDTLCIHASVGKKWWWDIM